MSTTNYDRQMEMEYLENEYKCCDCGGYHVKIRCPKSGRCSICGNDWPCKDCINLVKGE